MTAVIYLGLAAATVSVLGAGAATDVPLASLLAVASVRPVTLSPRSPPWC